MTLMELKKSMSEGSFRNLYIFYGEEFQILNIYINKLCEKIGGITYKSESIQNIIKTLNTKSLFASSKSIYVIRDDKSFLTDEKSWEGLEKQLKSKNITVIMKYGNIDSRSKFSKKFVDNIVEFTYLSESMLCKYIRKDLDISEEDCLYLAELCGKSYGRILLEVDKVKNLKKARRLSDNDAFRICKQNGVFYSEISGEVYELVDCIMKRDYKHVYSFMENSKKRGDNPLMIVSLLHNNVKAVLQITLAGTKNVTESTGLTGYQVKTAMEYVNKYKIEELVTFMKYLKYYEKAVKQGIVTSEDVVDYLIVNVM